MSKKQKKYQFFKRNAEGDVTDSGVAEIEGRLFQSYLNKYYNIWMSKFEWEGLDEGVAEQQENFIMRKFWADGTLAARKMDRIDTLVFAPYAPFEYDLYDFPSKCSLINLRNAPRTMIPEGPQVVGKDVVLGWAQPNHKPISEIVRMYIERMVSVDMVINTNLHLQKMPFLIGVNEADKERLQDVVRRILNNEVVVFASLEDAQRIQALATQTPYIIDKLNDYKQSLEKELLTYLGVDNNGSQSLEQTHVSIDAVNANNDIINDYGEAIEAEINKWLSLIEKVLGRKITIKAKSRPVESVAEDNQEDMEDEESE